MPLQHPCLRPVFVLGGIAGLLVACRAQNNDLEWWRNERQKIELSQHLELLKYRLAMRSGNGGNEAARLSAIQSSTASNRAALSTLRMTRETLTTEILNLQQQIDAAAQQAQQRKRANAIGQHFDSLTVARGRAFHDVSVQNVSDSGVSIRHTHGTARLRYSDLSDEQRTFFGLDQISAIEAEREEAEAVANYERQLTSQLRETKQIQQRISNENQRQARRPSPTLINQPIKSTSSSSFRIWRSRPRTYYYTPVYRYYGPVYRDTVPIQRPLPCPKPKSGFSS